MDGNKAFGTQHQMNGCVDSLLQTRYFASHGFHFDADASEHILQPVGPTNGGGAACNVQNASQGILVDRLSSSTSKLLSILSVVQPVVAVSGGCH